MIQSHSNEPRAWQLLTRLSVDSGKYAQGLFSAWQANSLLPNPDIQAIFVRCLNHIGITAHDPQLQVAVARAVIETWGAPADLAEHAGKLLKLDPLIQPYLEPSAKAINPKDIAALNAHNLLNALLQSAPICDLALEHFLTTLRQDLLLNPTLTIQAPQISASLAQQCFINEYVWPISDAESSALNKLDRSKPSMILACYQPLNTCTESTAWADKSWQAPIQAVIQQQIIEPREEASLATDMKVLTPINDDVSQAVQAMYEESPYPRWVRAAKSSSPQSLNSFLSNTYPLSSFKPLASDNPLQMLIAGDGTGQHP